MAETSSEVSSLAARYMKITTVELRCTINGTSAEKDKLVADIRKLAASCLAQDETQGQLVFDNIFSDDAD